MVKKKLGGGKRYKAVAAAKAEGKPEPEWEGPAPPLHVQKKLARKANFLDKVSRASAGAKLATRAGGIEKAKGKKKQGALPSLSTLSAVLDELGEGGAGSGKGGGRAGRAAGAAAGGPKQRGAAVKSAKQRQHILAEESSRLQQVLKHPAYVADPIAAITNHLRHTLPPPPAAGAGKAAARGPAAGKGGAGGKAGNKRGGKGSGNAMEE